ncbi:MAG: isochorismate synthase [Alphaproteobacteria bacterium]|nr:isochorismate synthase [Alphaproteobacteria bacterium]
MPELLTCTPERRAEPAPPRLLRFLRPLQVEDPWALLGSRHLDGLRLAAWNDPTEERCLLAAGHARELWPTGPERFAQAGAAWRDFEAQRVELRGAGPAEPLPFALAGFAFSPTPRRSAAWEAWGDGLLWVPELLIQRHAGACWAALTVPAGAGADAGLDRLNALLDALLAEARPPAAPRLASPRAASALSERAWRTWRQGVLDAADALRGEDLAKVVLARAERFESATGDFDPLATARLLRDQQASCVTFLVRGADGQSFVGATPEDLLRLRGRTLHTVALAGTRRRAEGDQDAALGREMLSNDKDRREQRHVLQAIRDALAPLSEQLDVPEQPEVARFAQVQHLRSPIRATLRDDVDVFELLARLHPTPAVGGLPRTDALRWLEAHEDLDRGWYAGPLGWIGPGGGGVFVVALRSALLQGPLATAFAGCGLVEGSDPRAEWVETCQKLEAVRSGLALG